METRQVNQVRVFGLVLNTFGRAEEGRLVALASSEEALRAWYESQLLEEPVRIDGWLYSFKEGPLRHNNPLFNWTHVSGDSFGHGWFDSWIEEGAIRNDVHRVDF